MRKKEMRTVMTFDTTSDAMAMEKLCKEHGIPGRIIPVPRQISAGCGLAWSMQVEDRKQVLEFTAENGLKYQAVGEYLI